MSIPKGTLTVKGITVRGSRLEYEYEIPLKDANAHLKHRTVNNQ